LVSLEGESTETGHGHALRADLRKSTSFNDMDVRHINLRIFDKAALGTVHTCAAHFTGASLFDEKTALTKVVSSTLSGRTHAACAGQGAPMTTEELQQQTTVWQLERRITIFHDTWLPPFLPHDGTNNRKWVSMGDCYEPHPCLPDGYLVDQVASSDTPPIPCLEVLGCVRPCTWHVVVDEENTSLNGPTDAEGWQYANDFYVAASWWWAGPPGALAYCRRRKWRPEFSSSRPRSADGEGKEASDEDVPARHSLIMTQKSLTTSARKTICNVDVGEISLEALADTLLADDCLQEGSLLKIFFDSMGVHDIQVGPWATGGAVANVKGKVRSVELRTPLPPNPMCPKETRVTSTWHVFADSSKVVFEQVSMSLDVPYGDSFN